MTSTMKLQMLLIPVAALAPAVEFFQQVCGLPLKFRDGDRYAALDANGLTVGLAAGEERIAEVPALVFRVTAIAAEVERLCSAGAELLRPAEQGPHEQRAVLRSPDGPVLVLSEKNASRGRHP